MSVLIRYMNTKRLDGKVAIVTGASKGIGAAIAKHLAAEGATVVANYSSSKEGADRVVDEITKQNGKAIAVRANVAKKAEVERLFSEAKKAFGRVDILVNNAGVSEFVPLEKPSWSQAATADTNSFQMGRDDTPLPSILRRSRSDAPYQ